MILSRTGIAADRASAIHGAISGTIDRSVSAAADRARIVAVKVEALALGSDVPILPGDEGFVMDESKMETLLRDVEALNQTGASISWGAAVKVPEGQQE